MSAPALSASLYIEFPTGDSQPGTWLRPHGLLAQLHRAGAVFGQNAGSTPTSDFCSPATPAPASSACKPRAATSIPVASRCSTTSPHASPSAPSSTAPSATTVALAKTSCRRFQEAHISSTTLMSVTFALLGGSHIASPRIGGQIGFEVDFPLRRGTAAKQPPPQPAHINIPTLEIAMTCKPEVLRSVPLFALARRRRDGSPRRTSRTQNLRRARAHLQSRRPGHGLCHGLRQSQGHNRRRGPAGSRRR